MEQLRTKIRPLGYLSFISDMGIGRSNKARIGIAKTDSPFELLKILDTNGENYDVSNEGVIVKLSKWHKIHPFTLIGANFDWVEMVFDKLPTEPELRALAKEMVAFCTDVVDDPDDEKSIERLIKDMKETKRMGFWWD